MKIVRLMPLPLLFLTVFLTGCGALQNRAPVGTQLVLSGDVGRYTIVTYERGAVETTAPAPSAPGNALDCGPYQIPEVPQLPPLPEVTAQQANDPNEVESILVNHIAELRDFARVYQSDIEDDYLAYRADCDPP